MPDERKSDREVCQVLSMNDTYLLTQYNLL